MQRVLPADLYVRAGLSGQSSYLDHDAQLALAAMPEVKRADFLRRQEVVLPGGGLPVLVVARPLDEDSVQKLLPLRRVASGRAPAGTVPVWISEALVDLRGLDLGKEFEVPLGGQRVRASVRGVWRDYERPGGVLVMPLDTYVKYTGDDRATSAALVLSSGADPDVVTGRVRDVLGSNGDYEVAVPREIRKLSLAVFDRTFAVTYLLEAVAVLIGLFGISASTSSQVLARRGEFGMLRHLGVTRREIGKMLAFEGAALGTIGVIAGLVVGAVVSLILIYVVNRQSFHWTMDVHVPWAVLAILSVVLIAAAALTSAFSGRQAMSDDVVRAVKEDW